MLNNPVFVYEFFFGNVNYLCRNISLREQIKQVLDMVVLWSVVLTYKCASDITFQLTAPSFQ